MRTKTTILLLIAAVFICSFAARTKLVITSSAFIEKGAIPMQYTCEGNQMSPPLKLSNIPPRTQSLALIVHDPDAPMKGGFTHWVMWNIPVQEDIPENYKAAMQGLNGAGQIGYTGPCPPTGTHRYNFKIYALDTKLNLSDQTDKQALEKAMKGHILGEGTLTGMYKKIKG